MNSTNQSIAFLLVGSILGGVLGLASYLWLLTAQTQLNVNKIPWIVIAVLFITALATVAGGMIGLASDRIHRDLKSGGNVWPYLRVAGKYFAVVLFVLLVRGNRHLLDLVVMPCLSAVAGVVFYGLVDVPQQTASRQSTGT